MTSAIHNKFILKITIALVSIFLLFASLPANAAETNIAVVDIEKLISQSTASENIQKQLEKEKAKLQKSFSKEEEKLKDLEKEILSKKDSLSESEFESEKKRFQKNLMNARQSLGQQVEKVERAANQALAELRQEILKTIAKMTEEEQYTMVITKQNVIIAEKELDITDEVMEQLNKNIKTIKLDL